MGGIAAGGWVEAGLGLLMILLKDLVLIHLH